MVMMVYEVSPLKTCLLIYTYKWLINTSDGFPSEMFALAVAEGDDQASGMIYVFMSSLAYLFYQ